VSLDVKNYIDCPKYKGKNMEKIIGKIIDVPFRALDSVVTTFLFTPKPRTPEELRALQEQLRANVWRKDGQIRILEEEISSLRSSLRESDSSERTLMDQLSKKEAELQRLLEKTKDLESRLLQAWKRIHR
jgi:hypothetical protein